MLREMSEDDLELVFVHRNHPDIRKCMFDSSLISKDSHYSWFERLKVDPTRKTFIYEDKGVARGVVNFSKLNSSRGGEWGFYIFTDSTRGTGSKLAVLALDKYFLELNGRRLNAEVLENNSKSVSFHLKMGFLEEGNLRKAHLTEAGYINVHLFGILKDEWLQTRKKFLKVIDEN